MTDEPQSDLTDAEKLAAFADLCIYAEAVTAENEWLREQVRLRDDAIAGLQKSHSAGFARDAAQAGFREKVSEQERKDAREAALAAMEAGGAL